MPVITPTNGAVGYDLPDSMVVAGSTQVLPGTSIIWFGKTSPDEDPSDQRISSDQDSGAVMTWVTDWQNVINPATYATIVGTLLGGWNGTKKCFPLAHPYLGGLYAKDIISVRSICLDYEAAGGAEPRQALKQQWTGKYRVAEITVSYETFPYKVGQTAPPGSTPEGAPAPVPLYNPNWIEFRGRAASNRETAPLGVYVYDGTPVPAMTGTYALQGMQYLTIRVHRVPEHHLFVGSPPTTPIVPYPKGSNIAGYVNAGVFLGYPDQSLFFDSMEYAGYGTGGDNSQTYIVDLHFIAWFTGKIGSDLGGLGAWNKKLSLTGDSYIEVHNTNGDPPFPKSDFYANLLNIINPP